MKKQSILVIFMLFISMVSNAQTIIDISIEQNPPLKVVAENVTLNIPPSGLTLEATLLWKEEMETSLILGLIVMVGFWTQRKVYL